MDDSGMSVSPRRFSLPGFGLVRLHRTEDVLPENRGFVVDEIKAEVDGGTIGHVKVENIPAARFRRFYPTIFNYMSQIKGVSGALPYDDRGIRYRDLADAQIVSLICATRPTYIPGSPSEYAGIARAELLAMVREIEAGHHAGRTGDAFRAFRTWHVDKPIIAYIEVDRPRAGLGTLLYAEAADWMRDRGHVLRSSTTQTPPAKAAWAKFARQGFTRRDVQGRLALLPHAADAMRTMIGAVPA